MKIRVIVSIFLAIAGMASAYSFKLGIQFYDSPSDMAACTLGVQPGATDGYDLGVDMPAMPPFMFYDAQILADGGITNMRTDIRSDTDSLHVWRVQFFNFTAPGVYARWLSSWAPSDSIRCLYIGQGLAADSTVVWTDMSTIDSFYIDAGYLALIKLEQDVEPVPPDSTPPEISDWFPEDGDTAVSESTYIAFTATDDTGIDTSFGAINLYVNGVDLGLLATRSPVTGGYRITYTPFLPFSAGSTVTVVANVKDRASPPNIASDTISFTIRGGGGGPGSPITLTVMVMLSGLTTSLSGSKVQITDLALSDTTDMMGTVVFDSIPPDTHTVVVSRLGYFSDGLTMCFDDDTLILFTLMEDTSGGGGGIAIDGTVDLAGSATLFGSILSLTSVLGDSSVKFDTTDALGHYSFTGNMPGLYNLIATHEGYISDSAYVFVFFEDTTIDFELGWGEAPDILLIDYDNGDELVPWGIGPAEWLYDILSAAMTTYPDYDLSMTVQDPDIKGLSLIGCQGIVLVTGTRLGTNAVIDDSSLQVLIEFSESGGNIYFEGPDVGTNYGDGTLIARDFFELFGGDYAAEGFSASTGNVERIALFPIEGHDIACDTVAYAYLSEADHYVDEFLADEGGVLAYSVDGPTPSVSNVRAVGRKVGESSRYISSFYIAAVESSAIRDEYIGDLINAMLNISGIGENVLPDDIGSITVEPNPFNSVCRITAPGPVEIYDLSGRLVAKIGATPPAPGSSAIYIWEAVDLSGNALPSGVYLALLRGEDGRFRTGRRLFLVR